MKPSADRSRRSHHIVAAYRRPHDPIVLGNPEASWGVIGLMRFALLVAVALAVTPVAGGSGASPPLPVEAVVVKTGRAPCGATARAGSLWVGVYGTGTVLHLDSRGHVDTRVRVGSGSCRVAAGRAAVWATRDRAGELVRIALGSGRQERVKVGSGAFDVLIARGSVWATSFDVGTVARIDPVLSRVTRVLKVGGNAAGLALCGGRIWVGHGRSSSWISTIDPTTLRIGRIEVGAEAPGWPTCIRGDVWVTTPHSVLRLDSRTGRILSRLRNGETLAYAAAAPDGLVWVTDKQHSVVHRVDPSGTSVVDSFPAGPGAFALARIGDSMWVTSFAGSDVRRFDR